MKLELSKSHNGNKTSTLVVFSSSVKSGKDDKANEKVKLTIEKVKISSASLQKELSDAIDSKSITGKSKEVVLFRKMHFEGHHSILVAGIGEKPNPENIRQIASAIYGSLKGSNAHEACIRFDGLAPSKKDLGPFVQAFAEGLLLSEYDFNELKSKKKISDMNSSNEKSSDEKKELHIVLETKLASDVHAKKALEHAITLSECVNFSRRLGDMPGNLMTPTILADTVLDAIKNTGIKAEIWDKARIKKERMGKRYIWN